MIYFCFFYSLLYCCSGPLFKCVKPEDDSTRYHSPRLAPAGGQPRRPAPRVPGQGKALAALAALAIAAPLVWRGSEGLGCPGLPGGGEQMSSRVVAPDTRGARRPGRRAAAPLPHGAGGGGGVGESGWPERETRCVTPITNPTFMGTR